MSCDVGYRHSLLLLDFCAPTAHRSRTHHHPRVSSYACWDANPPSPHVLARDAVHVPCYVCNPYRYCYKTLKKRPKSQPFRRTRAYAQGSFAQNPFCSSAHDEPCSHEGGGNTRRSRRGHRRCDLRADPRNTHWRIRGALYLPPYRWPLAKPPEGRRGVLWLDSAGRLPQHRATSTPEPAELSADGEEQ